MIGAAAEAFDEEQHQAVERKDDEENDEELRKLVLNDEDDVVLPVALDAFKEADWLILRGHGQKVHDYDVSLSGML
jgi:hypothetical protein